MSDFYTKKSIKDYLESRETLCGKVFDICKRDWVIPYDFSKRSHVVTSASDKNAPKAIFYHPWQTPQRYTEEEVKTQPLPVKTGFWPAEKKCTCGGQFVGGTHSDWCDINYKEDDELPF